MDPTRSNYSPPPDPAVHSEDQKTSDEGTKTSTSLEDTAISSVRNPPQAACETSDFSPPDSSGMPPASFYATAIISVSSPATEETQAVTEIPPPHLAQLRDTLYSICEHGILTPALSHRLAINFTPSMDMQSNLSVNNRLCCNYICGEEGIQTSLFHLAKGGLAVALERYGDQIGTLENPLDELSERAHQTILVVINVTINQTERDDYSTLNLISPDGTQLPNERVHLGNNEALDGCNESRITNSIAPSNFSFILIPERLESCVDMARVRRYCSHDSFQAVGVVSSTEHTIQSGRPFYEISIPDYETALHDIFKEHGSLLTHIVRGKTARDL